jgi:predicted permease
LVCGALLMLRSLINLQHVDPGVRVANVIAARIELPVSAYPTAESAVQFAQAAVERIQASPGVEQASVGSDAPLQGVGETDVILTPGYDRRMNFNLKHVDQDYFSTLGIPVLSGREIDGRDRKGAPGVIVVNEELARFLSASPGVGDPVGKVVHISVGEYGKTTAVLVDAEVVGVIRSERTGSLQDPGRPVAYAPFAQQPTPRINLIVRVRGDVSGAMRGVREAVRQIDPRLPLGALRTMEEIKERSFTGTTQSTWAIGAFAGVAALLAAFGLYGVLAQAVNQRRREIGIRIALGARSREIVAGIVRNAAAMVAAGLAIGLAGAFALTGLMKSILFQVSPVDPVAFAIACASLMLVALMAAFVPAHRATRVDPVTTLRDEG